MNTFSTTTTISGLIFDFGGTIDTNGQHWGKMLWRAYQYMGVPVTEKQFREAYVYGEQMLEKSMLIKPTDTLKRTIEVKLRLELEQLCMMGVWNVGETELKHTQSLLLQHIYQHISKTIERHRELLTTLHQQYPMVLCTNFYGNMQTVLHEFLLDTLFNQVVESAVVNIRKPDVRIFKKALQILQFPASQVLVIGDSYYKDIQPATKLGCQTAWLKGEGWIDRKYDESVPTYIIEQLTQILPICK